MSMIVGEGKYRFELIPDWVQIPNGWTIGQTGVVCDSRDRVYLFHRDPHPMMVFNRDGSFIETWGEGVYPTAHHLYMDKQERLYLPVWGSHVIVQTDTSGKQLMTLGTWNEPSNPVFKTNWLGRLRDKVDKSRGPFTSPTDVAVAPDGTIFVTDGYGNARVHRFSPTGKLEKSWGEPGEGPGQFRIPHSVELTRDGRVLVIDRENDRIQVFDPDGKYLDQWTGFTNPSHLFVDENDMVFISEGTGFHKGADPNAFMQIRTSDGKPVTGWKSPPGGAGGHGTWMDSHGDIYAAQNKEGQRILKYRRC